MDIAVAGVADHPDRQPVFAGDSVADCHCFGNPVDRYHDVFEGLHSAFHPGRFGKSLAGFPDFLRVGHQHSNRTVFGAQVIQCHGFILQVCFVISFQLDDHVMPVVTVRQSFL